MKAFIEAMNMKAHYENMRDKLQQKNKDFQIDQQKILAGKTSLKTLFRKGTKEDNVADIDKKINNVKKIIFSFINPSLLNF